MFIIDGISEIGETVKAEYTEGGMSNIFKLEMLKQIIDIISKHKDLMILTVIIVLFILFLVSHNAGYSIGKFWYYITN